jgi:hypothetical protein
MVSAARIVHRAGVHERVKGDHGSFVPLENDEVEAVGQRELGDALFEILEGLGAERKRAHEQEEEFCSGGFHAGSWLSQVSCFFYCTG